MTIEMRSREEFGVKEAQQVNRAQELRSDINWAKKKTLSVDKVQSGKLISFLKKKAIVLAGKTSDYKEDVAVILPQISTNDPERVEEVRTASVAIQKEATHKAAKQRLISLEAAEEKLQRIDDGVEPRPEITFQKTPGLAKRIDRMARLAGEKSEERQIKKTANVGPAAVTPKVWQVPTEKRRKVRKRNIVMVGNIAFLVAACGKVNMAPSQPKAKVEVKPEVATLEVGETVVAPSPTIAPEVQKGAVVSEELVTKWEEMGYPKDLREGGTITTVEKIINGQRREFLAWRVGWTMVYTDKELVDQNIDFISSEIEWVASVSSDEHKYPGEMPIPNPNEPGAPEQIEMLGAFAHAINLGILDRSQEEYDPAWYGQYLTYLKENPDITYVLEANLPVPGKPGSYGIGEVGTINASLPVEFIILPYRIDKDRANGPEQIFGGHPQAPFGLEWATRDSGYYGININKDGGLTVLFSGFLLKGKLLDWKFTGPSLIDMVRIVSAPAYIRTSKTSFAPGSNMEFIQQLFYLHYKDYKRENWPNTPNLIWGVPE